MTPTESSRGWAGTLLVAVLVATYAVSFMDRQIINLLVSDLRHDLSIGDFEVGILQGPAFGLFYAAFGMPLGLLADRVSRTRLIATGFLLWSCMTSLGGLAPDFHFLLATRVGVGIGEAALVPAAVSLIADHFPAERRTLPLAIFTAGVSIGSGLALVAGGWLVEFAHSGARTLPLIDKTLAGHGEWRIVLVLAGLIGLPLAACILVLPEPARGTAGTSNTSLRAFSRRHWRLIGPMLVGSALLYLYSNALSSWMPSLFIRRFGWRPGEVGLRMGTLILVSALAGNLVSGMMASRRVRSGRPSGALETMCLGAGLLAPTAVLAPLLNEPRFVAIALGGAYFSLALCFGVATAAFTAFTPPELRGRMVALYLLIGNLIGLGLGPPTAGYTSSLLADRPNAVGLALAIVAVLSTLPGALLLFSAVTPSTRLIVAASSSREALDA